MNSMRKLIMVGYLCAAGLAFGQTAPVATTDLGLHCWVGADGAPYFSRKIRCIADRELVAETLPDPQSPNVIDTLHRELHFGSAVSAERLYKANLERIRVSGEVWEIRIYNEPYDESWEEKRPMRLVNAVLCPRDTVCNVMFTR